MKGAGGTNGGLGMFFGGGALVVAGAYLLLTRVSVVSGGWHFYGYNAFGLSLIPLLVGIGMLFFNGRSIPGWLLTGAGALIIVVGIVANLQIYFQPTSLFERSPPASAWWRDPCAQSRPPARRSKAGE
jgi:hypothetical protein